jgi:hypothetical protein
VIDTNAFHNGAAFENDESLLGKFLKDKKLSKMSPTEYLKTITQLRKRLNGVRRDLVIDRTPPRKSARRRG